MRKIKFIKGDIVKIISGSDKDKQGPIIKFSKDCSRVYIEGINCLKHKKPNQQETEGGIVNIPKPIHVSNIQLVDPKNKNTITKISYKIENGVKKRIARKSGVFLK